jgi:pyridoxamine 5'-phosphate oxidase
MAKNNFIDTNLTVLQKPFSLFSDWFNEAKDHEVDFPDAMALATVNSEGFPSVRMVLLKSFDSQGFVFYTNLKSRKAKELDTNKLVSACFHWKSIKKQIRIEGIVERVSDEMADEYFASRPRLSQIGAWASIQSQPLPEPLALEKRVAHFTLKFNLQKVPRPEFWSGYRIVPQSIEFWREKAFRLHERSRFDKQDDQWVETDLYP